jgi:TetR/AcrR family transcriptional regulator, transcriptional repressor for nem operon
MYGYEGASLSVLQEVTGLTKGSLYGNFSDKQEIATEVFRYSMAKVREFVSGKIEGKKTAREKLIALVSFYADYVFNPPIPGGCPLLNHAVDADDHHSFLRETVASEIDRTIRFIASVLDEGKKNGEFSREIKSLELATIFFTSIEGALMVSRVSNSDVPMKIVVRHCKSILDTITI